ncbi:MAG: hypothetical protein HYU63_03540 [Armatimonadetes bacterium]|nr:hypothetical protein [Armatimonadota bacterium]
MRKKNSLAFWIFLIALTLAIIYILLDFHYTNLINKELARIKNLGEPLTLSDITPEEIPLQENAAYFYHPAIEHISYNSLDYIDYNSEEPETLINAFKKESDKVNKSLKENRLVFELLKLGYEKPKCRYNLRYNSSESNSKMKLLNFIACRSIVYEVNYKAASLILENKPEKAVEILAQGLRFARSITMQHTLLEYMMKINMEAYLMTPLKYMLEKNIKTNYQPVLNEINAILREQKIEFTKVLMTERALTIDFYENSLKSYLEPLLLTRPNYLHEILSFLLNLPFSKPLINIETLSFLKYSKQYIEDLRAYREPSATPKEMEKNFIFTLNIAANASRAFYQHKKTLQKFSKLKQALEKL